MLYREIISVCSEINTKHVSVLYGQKVDFFLVLNPVVHIVTTGPWWVQEHPTKMRELICAYHFS